MSTREIVVEALVKQYGQFQAVKGISFKVNSGEIFGFLGRTVLAKVPPSQC